MRKTILIAVIAALAAFAALPAGAAEGVCTWGGTPLERTGRFHFDTPLTNAHPAEEPIHFTATGPLAGLGAGCTGTMTFDGWLLPGSQCRLFLDWGHVEGAPGVAWFIGAGNAYGRGLLYGPDGRVAGSYDPQVITELPEITPKCLTPEGITDGYFSAGVQLLPTT